jgi:sulfonate transport system substrate-binding protein
MTRRSRVPLRVAVSAAALTALAAAGCSSSPSTSSSSSGSQTSGTNQTDLSSVTLNIGDQKGTGAYSLLKAAGLLNQLPFKADWSDFTSGPPMLQAMASGSVDIGGVGDAPPVFAASGGEGIEIVGARATSLGDQDALLVPKGSSVTSVSQLRGKKIAVSFGSSDDYQLLTVLAKAGLSPKDVTLVNLQPAPALAAFTSGAVDAWDIWPPYVQQAAEQDGAKVLAVGASYGSPYAFQVASKAAVSDPSKAAAIKAYLTVLNKAYVWQTTHTAAWAAIWAQATGLPLGIMQQAARVSAQSPVQIDGSIITSEQSLVDQFYSAGLIPAKVDISTYITKQFNNTVG